MKDYLLGNKELLELLRQQFFDKERAKQLLEDIPDINQPILNENGYSTTYLYEAQEANAVEAVRLLLEHGADPNFCNSDLSWGDCPLWDLQYWPDDKADDRNRFEIAKLFFEYGANPNLMIDWDHLFEYVAYRVYEDDWIGIDGAEFERRWEYLCNFYKLLIAYGGGDRYYKPELSGEIQLDRIEDYEIIVRTCEDGYHVQGILLDPDGKEIGQL